VLVVGASVVVGGTLVVGGAVVVDCTVVVGVAVVVGAAAVVESVSTATVAAVGEASGSELDPHAAPRRTATHKIRPKTDISTPEFGPGKKD
jgi:hypothetical protein